MPAHLTCRHVPLFHHIVLAGEPSFFFVWGGDRIQDPSLSKTFGRVGVEVFKNPI